MGVGLNLSVIVIFYWGLKEFTNTPDNLPMLQEFLLWLSLGMLIFVLPSFMMSVTINPGYI